MLPGRKFYVIFNGIQKVATELFCSGADMHKKYNSRRNNSRTKALSISDYVPRLENSLNIAGQSVII